MKEIYIDINCDVGEGIGNENSLLPLISSCNIACGGHAGDNETMDYVVKLAKDNIVLVGAHPSYPDKDNFGRTSMDIESGALIDSVQKQILGLERILTKYEVELHHIKPHGALYNDLITDVELAHWFLKAVTPYRKTVVLYVPSHSVIAHKALEQGFGIKYEAFADRNYNQDLSLVPRKLPNAVIDEPTEVLKHLVRLIKDREVLTIEGKAIAINADTYCLHGDTPNALQILMYLTQELPKHQIHIQ